MTIIATFGANYFIHLLRRSLTRSNGHDNSGSSTLPRWTLSTRHIRTRTVHRRLPWTVPSSLYRARLVSKVSFGCSWECMIRLNEIMEGVLHLHAILMEMRQDDVKRIQSCSYKSLNSVLYGMSTALVGDIVVGFISSLSLIVTRLLTLLSPYSHSPMTSPCRYSWTYLARSFTSGNQGHIQRSSSYLVEEYLVITHGRTGANEILADIDAR